MKRGQRRSLRADNMKRLRSLGLPTDLFSAGFWEREAAAKMREALLLAAFEAMWKFGDWDHLSLPFQDIIERWKAEIVSPLHFASIGPNPRWVPVVGDACVTGDDTRVVATEQADASTGGSRSPSNARNRASVRLTGCVNSLRR